MKEYEDKKSKEWIEMVEGHLPSFLKRNLLRLPLDVHHIKTGTIKLTLQIFKILEVRARAFCCIFNVDYLNIFGHKGILFLKNLRIKKLLKV